MKKFLLGFAEGYFIVSLIIYIATYLILKNPINTLFYPETYPILLGLFYLGYKYKTTESKSGNWLTIRLEFGMKVFQLLRKAWPETTVLFGSMAYLLIRIVADVNKIDLPKWFEYFDIPTISLFLMTFILLYRSEEKDNKRWQHESDLCNSSIKKSWSVRPMNHNLHLVRRVSGC